MEQSINGNNYTERPIDAYKRIFYEATGFEITENRLLGNWSGIPTLDELRFPDVLVEDEKDPRSFYKSHDFGSPRNPGPHKFLTVSPEEFRELMESRLVSGFGKLVFNSVNVDFPVMLGNLTVKSLMIQDSVFSNGFFLDDSLISEFYTRHSSFENYLSFKNAWVKNVFINKSRIEDVIFFGTEADYEISLSESQVDRCLFIGTHSSGTDTPLVIDLQFSIIAQIDFIPTSYEDIQLRIANAELNRFSTTSGIERVKFRNPFLMDEKELYRSFERNVFSSTDFEREASGFARESWKGLSSREKREWIRKECVREIETMADLLLKCSMKAESDKFYYDACKLRTKGKRLLSRAWDTIVVDWMFGWGVKIHRAFLAIFVIVGLFTSLLYVEPIGKMNLVYKDAIITQTGAIINDQIDPVNEVLPDFSQKFLFSFQSFLGGFLFSDYGIAKDGKDSPNPLLVLLFKMEGLIGILFIAMLTAVLSNRLERK